jgi:hypothetical protein
MLVSKTKAAAMLRDKRFSAFSGFFQNQHFIAFSHFVPLMTHPIFVADFGRDWTVLNGEDKTTTRMTKEQFASLSWLPNGSVLVSENAHLGVPRNDLSLAQVYMADELFEIYDRAHRKGCIIKLFPNQLTAKARSMFGDGGKTDENDAKAIYGMVTNCPHLKLMNPPKTFVVEKSREAGWAYKDETNCILNKARGQEYQDPDDAIVQLLEANLHDIAAKLSPMARSVFALDKTKRDGNFYASDTRNVKLYTIAALFFHPNGSVRLRPDTGAVPGKTWLRRNVLHTSPFHFRGGIARSNLYWHGFRNYAIKKMGTRKASSKGKVLSHYDFTPEQDAEFRQHRRDYIKAVMELVGIFQEMARNLVHAENQR